MGSTTVARTHPAHAVALASLIIAAAWLLVSPRPAAAWGSTGHRMISKLAIENLPDEVPDFLRAAGLSDDVGELGREPDRLRGAGKSQDADHDRGHFLDLDDEATALGVPIDPLPDNREAFDTALRAKSQDQYKSGFLPYEIVDGWQQLQKDFAYWRVDRVGEQRAATAEDRAWLAQDRRRRELLILRDLGYWSHFVGDGSQPLHLSIHFNGWGPFPNPNNYSTSNKLHAFFEGDFVRNHVDPGNVAARVRPYQDCGCTVEQRTVKYLLATQSQVIPLYEIEKASGFDGTSQTGKDFAADRLAAGVSELRDLIIEAWRSSADATVGFPPVRARDVEQGAAIPMDQLKGLD
jgi:hypothetical protein